MKPLNHAKESIFKLFCPASSFKLTAYFFVFMLTVLVAGCGEGEGVTESAVEGLTESAGEDVTESAEPEVTPPDVVPADVNASVIAKTGPIVAVRVGETTILDGSQSFTSSSSALRFSWSFNHKPDASNASLQGATTANPSFVADARGVYMVQLVASATGVTSQRAIQTVVVTLEGERLTGPFNHPGLSSDCVNCHNGGLINPGKSPDHIATSNLCQACHTPQGAAIIPFVDHQEVFGNCSECHNGITAIGKSAFHTPTNAECDDCHNTNHFLELAQDGSFDHSNISRSCSGCHNGTVAKSKHDLHVATSTECGYCHTTTSFLPAYPDHTNPAVVGNGCDSCHNGSTATGQSVGHPATRVDCDTCHNIETFNLGGIFDHSVIESVSQPCADCHNDNSSINAPGKSSAVSGHVATNSDCGSCHNTESFVGGFVDHTGPDVVGKNCDSCHGDTATGKSPNHMPTSEDCSVCHTPGTFTSGFFSHGPGYIDPPALCTNCHNNVITVGKLINHLPTNGDCGDCHQTTGFLPAAFDHTGIAGNCVSCHDGNISTGKAFNHLPTDQDCSICHTYTTIGSSPAPFKDAQSVHAGITGNCESCHSGNPDHAAVGAIGKQPDHIPAMNECFVCHKDTTTGGFEISATFKSDVHSGLTQGCEGCHVSQFLPTANSKQNITKAASHLPTVQDCYLCHTIDLFIPSTFAHTGITGDCASCHDGNVNSVAVNARSATNTTIHQSTNEDCGTCHNTTNFLDAFVDHSGPDVVGKRCDACHDGGAGGATGKHAGHVPTNQDCDVCHVAGGTFIPAVFDHTGIVDNCASCHDGIAATGKNAKTQPAHIPTTEDCSSCHIPTAFADARFDHQGIVDNCTSCHNGTTARGKVPPPNHVPTNDDCSSCHLTTGFVPATFDHAGIVNNCRSCHDGVFAEGKSDSHVPTNQDCSICHTSSGFFGAVFDHTGTVDNCASSGCHTGIAGEASGKPLNHMQTAEDCSVCHTPGTFSTGIFNHVGVVDNCESCHNNVIGTGKSSKHLPTQQDCNVCHITTAPFYPAQGFVHSGISNNCESCHDGSPDYVLVGAIGAPATTIHLSTNQDCSVCHNTVNFADAFVDHTDPEVISKRCDACHDGGAGGAIDKHSGHVVTNEDCSACHVPGTFTTAVFNHTGIIDNCVSCHNTVTAIGKIPSHAATSNKCEACHTPVDFATVSSVDHQEVFGNCSECHNGDVAIGKSEFHAPTNAECDDCHNTSHFLELGPDGNYDHSNIIRECSGCHNDTVSQGKNESHIATNTECGSCHTTNSFSPAYPDHTNPAVIGNGCDSCHVANGSGSAAGQSVGHPVTSVDCGVCHSIVTFSLGGVFNHRLVDPAVQLCESCHNDNNSINAPGKASAVPTHPATTDDCGSCHNTVSFTGAFVDHTNIVDNCASCHSDNASGKSLNHMPTTEDCSVCHTPGTFTTGTYDHAGITNGCNTCHDNTISVGKLPNHIPTSPDSQDCAVCHNTTSFAGATFDHTSTDTSNCLACHDGNISKGKSLGHIVTNENCSSCHNATNNGFSSFAGTFFHNTNVVGGDCASCHNTGIALPRKVNHIPAQAECSVCHSNTNTDGFALTTFLNPAGEHQKINNGCDGCHISRFIDNPFALKAPGHLPTGQDCDVCHTNNALIPSIFNHSGISDNCASCHDGNVNHVTAGARGTTNTALHRSTIQDCGACHNTANFADAFVDHNGPDVAGKRCDSCHDGGAGGAIGKDAGHVVTNEDCSVCHVPGTFASAVFNHTGIVNNCASCHDGVTATGKNAKTNPAHVPTSEDCSVCHIPTAFADARFDHQGIVDNCASCHDGATARGKMPPPDHVPTNGDCSNCHQTTSFVPATFSHIGIVDNCSSCHDGTFAIGKSANHIPTSKDCGTCHTTRLPLSFTGAVFDHIGIVNNCVFCHDGSTAIGMDAKTNPAHLATGLDCHNCHTTATFIGGTWIHDASTVGQCDTCHVTNGGARSKPSGHLSTNVQCDVCHSTNGWAPASFSHSSNGGYPGDHRRDPGCSGCHGNSIVSPFVYRWSQYAPDCAACHANDFESKSDHIGGKSGTVEQNKDCGGSGCHRVSDSDFD